MQSELTIHDYIDQLFADKQILYAALKDVGYEDVTVDDTYTELVPKVASYKNSLFNQTPDVSEFDYNASSNWGIGWLAKFFVKRWPNEIQIADNVTKLVSLCAGIGSKIAPKLIAKNVTNMVKLYAGASAIEYVDLSEFSCNKITTAYAAFYDCKKLRQISSESWYHLTNMSLAFSNTNIRELHMHAPLLRSLAETFRSCWEAITEPTTIILDINGSTITSLDTCFRGSGPNTQYTKINNGLYIDCSSWKSGSSVAMGWAFLECYNMTFDFRNFDFTGGTGSSWFSYHCGCTLIVKDAEQKAVIVNKGYTGSAYGVKVYTVEEWEALQNG